MDIQILVGKTVTKINADDETDIECGSEKFRIYHEQDCCESVTLVRKDGIPEVPFTILEVGTGGTYDSDDDGVSETNEFTFVTDKGIFNLVWQGYSNGYYGTSVAFYKYRPNEDRYDCWGE